MKTGFLKNQLLPFLFVLLGFLSSYTVNAQICINNPSIQQGNVSSTTGPGTLQFSFFENLLDYTDEENDPIVIDICLLGIVPQNGLGSIGGSFAPTFNWSYNQLTNCYRAVQNQDIWGGTGGLITVNYNLINYGSCPHLDLGFIAILTTPTCMNGINETVDDIVSVNTNPYGSGMQTNPSDCFGANGGAAYNYGTGNFDLQWSTGETTQSINNLNTGIYTITVTDLSNGCSYPRSFEIVSDTSCQGVILGNITMDYTVPDCQIDPSSVPSVARRVNLYQSGNFIGSRMTDTDGNYSFNVANGTYVVEVEQRPVDIFNCGTTNQQTVNVTSQTNFVADFIHDVTPNENLCVFHNALRARPGFIQWHTIEYCNLGTTNSSGTLEFVHDPLTNNFTPSSGSATTTYDATTQTATWDFANLPPGQCETVKFRVTVSPPPTVNIDDTLYFQTSISPTMNDIDLENNYMNTEVIVVGSYDPNDKQNLVGESSWGGSVLPSDDQFKYYIRFQNTGTDTAFTVVVRDEIDVSTLDISSVKPVSSSHAYSMTTENSSTLVFRFDDILLVDSFTNEPASNGYICFTIDLLPNLPLGTVIENQAGIYFDFNLPIITNNLVNTIEIPLAIADPVFDGFVSVYPNPNEGEMSLDIYLYSADELSIELLDINGKVLKQIAESAYGTGSHEIQLTLTDLPDGLYFVRVAGSQSSKITKVVVQR